MKTLSMKILFVITRADTVGGAQVHVIELSRLLIQQGHEVLVFTGARGIYNDRLVQLNIKTIACEQLQPPINPGLDWQSFKALRQVVRQFQPDLVCTHSSKAGVIGRLVCRLEQIPCIFTAHGWAFTTGVPAMKRFVYQNIEKLIEPLAAKIICVSEYDRQLALSAGMQPQRLLTIHNGVIDVPAQLRAQPELSQPVKIVMVARFDRQKDHFTLFKAFSELHDIEQAQLELVGDGPTLGAMQDLVMDLGISNRVKFWGFRSDIAEILAQAQVFTLVSHWEGFPRVTLEAMRAGLPVVITNAGGSAEAIAEGVSGYVIEPGDSEALRDRLQILVSDAKLRSEMGRQGRRLYEQKFTLERLGQQTFAVYEQVLDSQISGNDSV
jgi:glycosyltransferase involved in cell wall biosynthesis